MMRPTVTTSGKPIYECFTCGNRERDPERRVCGRCDSEMRNLGRDRDC